METHQCRLRGWCGLAAVALAPLLASSIGKAQAGPDAPGTGTGAITDRLQDQLAQVSRLLDEERLIRVRIAMREQLSEADAQGAAMAWSLNDAGLLMAREGRLDIAKALFERALKNAESNFGLIHPARGTLLQNLGDVQLLLRDPAAVDRYREAATVFQTVVGPSHPRLASVLNGWATALGSLGHADEAEALYRRAIRIYEDHEADRGRKRGSQRHESRADPDPLDLVAPLHNLALLLIDGRRLTESEALLDKAYRQLKRHGRHEASQAIPILRALARLQRASGNIEKAGSYDYIANRLEMKQANAASGDSP